MQFFQNLLLAAVALLPAGAIGAPTALSQKNAGEIIEGAYIVVLNTDVSTEAFASHKTWASQRLATRKAKRDTGSGGVRYSYSFGRLKGYSGTFDRKTVGEIAARTEVAYVEPDRVVKLDALTNQRNAPSWGLGRVSSRSRGNPDYYYDDSAGAGVTAYVIDTGIQTTHNEFEGRAIFGYNAVDTYNADRNGHGTHVSGTIGGRTFGVAKRVQLVAVKVLDGSGSGSTSGVIAGIQWAARDSAGKKAVANMSLGGSYSAAMNSAVANAVNSGLTFVVAAGNSGANAANFSPASQTRAITVGATDGNDVRAPYSNYGSVLDIFAPGSNIVSSYIGSNSATKSLSGTSMACPHVAGVVAYLLGQENLSSPAAVARRLFSLSSSRYVSSPGSGSPNRLLYNGAN